MPGTQVPADTPALLRSPAEIGRLARTRRKSLGLTIRQFSEQSGLSLGFIVDMERGKPTAALGRVLHALALLGIDLMAAPR